VTRLVSALDVRFPPLAAHPDLPDRVAVVLHDLAPAAVHELGPDERPTWRVFIGDARATGIAAARLTAEFGVQGLDIAIVSIEDEDWAAKSQAHLTRVNVGRVTVAPPWDAAPPGGGVLVIIHPSTGFGTGHHQSTRLCLQLLQKSPVSGARVLDLGTGSGVLALAAWRLGAAEIDAVDYDPDAIANACDNLRLNGVDGQIALHAIDLRVQPIAPADIVLANLTGALLIAQAPQLVTSVRAGGTLIVSGFVTAETAAVAACLTPPLRLVETLAEGDWRAMRLTQPAP
jgi:ribosomal protein L11 methyltransferase